ncbi:GNAT family N-acetyltransferase [Nocardia takedensis]|uniref:GNAT family N-acetyltransferase n=1 Tax=Nocardia takedensis TaxID=259390 RepID=UPI003F775DB2
MLTITQSTSPTVEIRHATTRGELREMLRWRRVAGNSLSRHAKHHLLHIHEGRLLSTGLSPGFAAALSHGWHAPVSIPTVIAARTMALVAVIDGLPVGGLVAGPSMLLCARLSHAGPRAVLHAALSTIELHAVAVDEVWRRRGIGSALLRRAVQICQESDVGIIYGHIDTTRPVQKTFADHHRWQVAEPKTPLDLRPHIGLPISVAPRAFYESLCHRRIGDRP